MKKQRNSLSKKMHDYCNAGYYPFHTPGHKRKFPQAYSYDITEVGEFDYLHQASGIIKEIMQKARALYGSKESYLLVNGSTGGVLASVFASFKAGDTVIVARNCHKSVYHAIELRQIKAAYIYPEYINDLDVYGKVLPTMIEEAIRKNPEARGIILTSPTYEGIFSDIKSISKLAHEKDLALIVDEAHGAHFGMHPFFPESALKAGADIVIQSLHKTLLSLTQTAILHYNSNLVEQEKLKKYLEIFQTSSPSYIFMESIERNIEKLKEEADEVFGKYVKRLEVFREKAKNLCKISLVERDDADISRLVFSTKGSSINGKDLYYLLEKDYKIQFEMAAESYIIGISTLMDVEEDFDFLYKALKEIDSKIDKGKIENSSHSIKGENERVYEIWEAAERPSRKVAIEDALNKVSAEYVYYYPPGIPFLVPGEKINEDILKKCKEIKKEIQII